MRRKRAVSQIGVAFLAIVGSTPGLAGQQSRVEVVEVPAPSLEANLVGTAAIQRATVYLPPGYDGGQARYPVIYMLHGIFDQHGVWVEQYELDGMVDRLIDAEAIPPVIVVMPDGGNRYGGGFYRDSPTTGGWARFVASDLVSFVDGRFRTRADPGARALVGHSMGGYGAVHVPMEWPGVFSIAWAMSPCCLGPVEDIGLGNPAWLEAAGLMDEAELARAVARRDFYVVVSMGLAAAFAPDPSAPPFHVDFPFRVERGEMVLDEDKYIAFRNRFPVHRIEERRAALLGLTSLTLDYGIGEQFAHIPAATSAFSQALTLWRVPHRLEVYRGDHRNRVGHRLEELVLPYIGALLGR